MININKLKGKIVENGTNVETIARQMGMDKATLYRRFADEGKNFTIGEAQEISSILNLTRDEINDIFLPRMSHDMRIRGGKEVNT